MGVKIVLHSLAATTLVLTGCASTVPLNAAVLANDPTCAEVMVRLPDTIGELERRSTNAQSTAAWGDPAAVLLRCGLEPTGPSELPCFTVNGIDWLRDDAQAPAFVFTTYGRTPSVEIVIDSEATSGTEALDALGNAVGMIPATAECLSAEDVFG
ncbi:uncharacterized protein DUF3515 [Microbacteriaceae bacterium MWH-Ta3]|nr:uncharacterized protein DUF3515 [Microbacteriaceae bacterium MWH-Ta3]